MASIEMKMSALMAHTCPLHPTLRPFVAGRVHAPRRPVTAAGNDNGAPTKQGIGEDMLAKLRAAEEEAAKLREELAKAKADAAAKVIWKNRHGHPLDLLSSNTCNSC